MSTQAGLAASADEVPVSQAPPPADPRRERPRRRRGRWVLLAVVVAVLVGWLAWASPVTLVKHVQVSAPRGISEESIRLASGISAADHVPAVDAEKVRVAIMAELPAVADVRLRRSLPDTIRLEVVARTPLAAVASGKGFYVMDADGVVYDKVASAKKLPVIKASTAVGRETARGVLLSLPESARKDVRQVRATTRDDVSLTLKGGATVRWGSAEDAELKARVLSALLAVKADTYDVSSPLQPTTSGGPEAGNSSPTP